ncbi:multi-sensor hybrid histidine kinase [Oscillochloris trichoides DG-6]|uniref:Circadian input-output histidine kinase CikA n=1 Tax=Oscillochloris trichoides DG-6 TaxID=765420 RepID=E1IAB4_9CHLR|nr:response regulator [Oscillochloris trichoides]EFO81868.1 multi-sensor hybrid histidine kinase [Oscillochloris trichoides DG-6]
MPSTRDARPYLRWLRPFGIALLYLLASWAGVYLSGLPQGPPIFWPAAGVALAAMVIYGWAAALGIFLGSFIAFLLFFSYRLTPGLAILAACTVLIQAGSATFLLRRFVLPLPPTTIRMTLRAIGFSFLCSMISPLLLAITYALLGLMPWEQIVTFGSRWWVGIATGILIVAPALIVGGQWHHRQPIIQPFLWPITSLMIGMALLTFTLAVHEEDRQIATRLETDSSEMVRIVTAQLIEHEYNLMALRSFYAASHEVDAAEFHQFVSPLLERSPTISLVVWAPYIRNSERAAFEHSQRMIGRVGFSITQYTPTGQFIPASQRAFYFPGTFFEPYTINQVALGFDVASEPVRYATLTRASQSGQSMLTSPIRLVSRPQAPPHILLISPIYASNAPLASIAEREAALRGIVFASIQMDTLLSYALNHLTPRAIDLVFYDVTDSAPQLLAYRPFDPQQTAAPRDPDAALAEGYSQSLTIFGRHWQVLTRADPTYIADIRGRIAWPILSVGLASVIAFLLFMAAWLRNTQALRAREEIFSAIVGQAVDAIALFDVATERFVEFNTAAHEGLGYTRDEFAQKSLLDIQAQHSSAEIRHNIEQILTEGSASFETQHLHKDGSLRMVEVRARRLNLQRRNYIAGVWTDITERKADDLQLRKLNRAYMVLSAVNEMIVRERDPQRLFTTACQIAVSRGGFTMAWVGLLDPTTHAVLPVASAGFTNGYLDQLQISLADNPRGHGPVATALRTQHHVIANDIATDPRMEPWRANALKRGYSSVGVFPLIVRGQVRGVISLYASEVHFFDQAEIQLFDEMANDLAFALEFTEQERQRRLAEEQLRTSEHRSRVLLNAIPDMMFRLGLDGRLLDYFGNPEQRLYVPPEIFLGRMLNEILPPDVTAQWNNAILAAPQGLQTFEYVLLIDGEPVSFEARLVLNEDEHEVVAIVRDITARKQMERDLLHERQSLARRVAERTEDLSRANQELARAVRAKDDFLANMSHELRTPLNAILALSEGMLEQLRGPLNERQIAALRNIESSGRHLLALINDILDLSKIEAGRMDLQIDQILVSDVCAASMIFIKEQASKKQQKINLIQEESGLRFYADQRRLKQMLVNLLTNAVKFTPVGGQIDLIVKADASQGVLAITVADTGIGISDEEMQRLFKPFIQLDSGLTRQHEGTGLGLALVRRLAELHGGSVSLESTPGVGSRFTILLPYMPLETQATRVETDVLAWTKFRTALVIEDSETSGEQIARYLGELRIDTTIHSRGAGALDRVLSVHPDVIFLDIQLPDQSGWEVLEHLKADPHLRSIPVIIISVLDDRIRGMAAGASAYLVKPITRDILRHTLSSIGTTANLPPPPAPPALSEMPPRIAGAALARILLAEDNEINITAIGDYLSDKGYTLTIARNGREAVALAHETHPDLILMDIQMPELDGLSATRQLRATPTFATTPIIALTALAMPGDRERCLAAGANEYMAKPISLRSLVLVIEQLLQTEH